MFAAIDANGDGVISRQEFQQAFAAGVCGGQAYGGQAAATASCPNCGNTYAPDAVFCRKCGMKRQQVVAGQLPVYSPGASAVAQPGAMQYGAPQMAGAMQYGVPVMAAAAQTGPAQWGQAVQTLQGPVAAAQNQTVTYAVSQPQQFTNTTYSAATQPAVWAGSSAAVPGMTTSYVPPVAQTFGATQQVQYISATQNHIPAAPMGMTTVSAAQQYSAPQFSAAVPVQQFSAAPAVHQPAQTVTTYVTQSPATSHRQETAALPVMPRREPQPNLEHRVVGERHITREELLETGNLVETEGSVVQSTQPPSSLLSSQSRPAVSARPYAADPFLASGATLAKSYASPSTVLSGNVATTYSPPVAVSNGHASMAYSYPATTLGAETVHMVQYAQPTSMMTAPAAQQRGDFFDVFDTNHDGVIDRSEFQHAAAATMNMGSYSGAPTMAVASSSSVCPACGNIYAADAAFCRKCGRQRDTAGTLSGAPVAVI
eukprot:TRINITY_DN43437_c0_g1_i1.p1 TRINITY_DN43437_c0_g1~~TRINITY_DN43437_c0_g1_i1.p1  ORF type:complete len:485 (-),score=78.07 TRINITY_DN43437_c0_g1_i1:282-1736(-)